MRPPKYALEPLVQLRARELSDASRELGRAVHARQDASRARERAAGDEARHDADARAARAAEDAALAHGELCAIDLMRADAWQARVRAEQAELADRLASASGREAARAVAEGVAREELARRKAEADIVERDRSRFRAREKLASEARDEEAADEIFGAGRMR